MREYKMGRVKKTPFPDWQTKKSNGIEERYVRLGNSQLTDENVNLLSHIAFRMYVYMLLESRGRQEFEMPRRKYKKFMSAGGASKAIRELVERGFIDVVQQNKNLRKANVYRFSCRWKGT